MFDVAELPMLFKLESSRKLLDETQAGRWAGVKEQVVAELKLARHRASADAKVLQLTLVRILASRA